MALTLPVKVDFNNIHGGEVHEAEAQAGHEAHGHVEHGQGGRGHVLYGEPCHQQTKGSQEHSLNITFQIREKRFF